MLPLWGGSTYGKGLLAVLNPPHPLVAKNDTNSFSRLVLTHPPPPLPWALAWAWAWEHPLACPPLGMQGWDGGGRGPLGWAWEPSWRVPRRGGGVFSLGGFLLHTGESASQVEALEGRKEEKEEESVEDSQEGSEEDSPGSLFLFWGGGVGRGFGF